MSADLDRLAAEHGFSPDAVRALTEAIRQGGGGMAQFSHPELGGMGQWSKGGMTMIGTMNAPELKARVNDLAHALATGAGAQEPPRPDRSWWPAELGRPAATGAQNGVRYALFPDAHRVALEQAGQVTVHDTGDRTLTGISQQQSSIRSLTFSGPQGTVAAADLPKA